jgi:type I restriction enzyme, S subunit
MSEDAQVGLGSLSELVAPVDEKIAVKKDPNLPYVGLEHIGQRNSQLLGWASSETSVSVNSVFEAGDVLFGKLRPNLRKCVSAPFSGYCSTDILVLRVRNGNDAGFAARVFQAEAVGAEAERTSMGTKMPRTSWKGLSQFRVPIPEPKQQSKIAEVLVTLDAAIRGTEAVVAKLRAMKQGLLHDLLTRGIDANGDLRPPQPEAPHLYHQTPLGWLPKEWEVRLLDDVAQRGSGHTPSKSIASYWNGGIKWVSLADSHRLDQVYIRETDKEISEAGLANSSAVKHPENTVILSRDAGIGKSAILGSEMAVSQHFMAWRCGAKLNYMFFYYLLQREKPRFEAIAMGSTIKTIGLSFFKKYVVALPPRAEQDRTAEILLGAEGNISCQEDELDKLRLQKSGLMDDLLTGRVPVTPLL